MYELKSRVRYSEADERGELSVSGLMNYLQDCCTMQAEDLGIGLAYLRENHIGWMVTSYQIKIVGAMPKVGDEIIVTTWPYHFRGMLGYRNFTIRRATGETVAEVDSLWVLMDLGSLKPARLPEKMVAAYKVHPQIEGAWDLRRKTVYEHAVKTDSFVVSNMHLDTNHHMNNANYVMAAAAYLPANSQVREIYVAFKKAAVLGDVVECCVEKRQDGMAVLLKSPEGEEYSAVEFRC